MHQAGRGERLELLVEPGAQARQQAEGHIMGGQALGVAKDATGDPEETHAHDGDFQRAQFRMQSGGGDQEGGSAHQANVAADRQRTQ